MSAELKAILTADIKNLEAQLDRAKKELRGFGDQVDKESSKSGKGFKQVGKSAANAQPALQEFSRVIQDAPFGIQGVGNNIQQLTANFGNLSRSAGGTIPALRLMFASLAGPAGILLAVSAVTSALTVFANSGLLKSRTEAEKLAEAQKELAEGLEKYRESLTGVNKARLEGNRGAAEELVNLRLLRGQIENTNNSLELRRDGIRQLVDQYPTYFKNVKEEQFLNGTLQTTYENLTKAIISRAKATAASDLLVENAKREIAINQQLEDSKEKQTAKELELQKAKLKGNQASTNVLVGGAGSFNAKLVEQGVIQKDINNLTADQIKLQEQLTKIAEENNKLTSFIEPNLVIDPNTKLPDTKSLGDKFKNTFKNNDDIFGITEAAQKSLENTKFVFENFATQFNSTGDIIGFALKDSVAKIRPQLALIEEALIGFNERANTVIQDGIANTFAGIGEGIGNALVDGGNIFDNLGKSLLSSLGGVLVQLGQLAIQTGVGLLAVKLALKTLNPAVAIGAGVALVAIGSAFSKSAKNIGSESFGGGSGGIGGQGSSGSSSFSGGGFSSSVGGGRVVFEISGQKLIGVLNNTLEGNRRLGGNVSLE